MSWQVAHAIVEFAGKGLLDWRMLGLFLVPWLSRRVVDRGVPFGVRCAMCQRGGLVVNPMMRLLRPICRSL